MRSARVVLIQAEPGTGKTTRIPPFLLTLLPGTILVLEPRRLAARLAAGRIAEELGEAVGETAGYHIRHERKAGPGTRLEFLTEGLFLRRLLSRPELEGVSAVVLDEFHERHLQTEMALALVRHLQRTVRPDLKLVIMSATLDMPDLTGRLPEARALQVPGELHPVEIRYRPGADGRNPEAGVRQAVQELWDDPECPGDILVFLPGAADIRRTAEILGRSRPGREGLILELRAELPEREIRRVFEPANRRKIILSTNVAETSVTIPGVTGVVDCGLAKIPGFAPWNGLPTLDLQPVCQASCCQRAGRAGRLGPGVAVRLYSLPDYQSRPANEKPEIQRLDLASPVLQLSLLSRRLPAAPFELEALPWVAEPPPAKLAAARELLRQLGAIGGDGKLTPAGEEMAGFPLHPRLARVAVEGIRRGIGPAAILAAALVEEGMVIRRTGETAVIGSSDVDYQLELIRLAQPENRSDATEARRGVDPVRLRQVLSAAREMLAERKMNLGAALAPFPEEVMACSFLTGFPDRVARRRVPGAGRSKSRRPDQSGVVMLNLCAGGGARLSRESVVQDDEWLLALDAEDSPKGADAAGSARVRVAIGLQPEMLMEVSSDWLQETDEYRWDAEREKVEAVRRLTWGQLTLEELLFPGDPGRIEEILVLQVKQRWPNPFSDEEPLLAYESRARLVMAAGNEAVRPVLAGEGLEAFIRFICRGRNSFAGLTAKPLPEYLRAWAGERAWQLLDEWAPLYIPVGTRRRVAVHYAGENTPWVESRLQDFFGLRQTPAIAKGRMPLVVHLLAPNGRAVQVTQDLPGFWERVYPKLRKELSRRYPRHAWPEDPLQFPPEPFRQAK